MSVGLSLVFGVTKIVNFAHGALLMIGAYVGYWLAVNFGSSAIGFWLCILGAALFCGLLGALLELTLLRRLYGAPELFQLLATFAVALIAEDALLLVFGSEDLLGPRAPGIPAAVRLFGQPIPVYDLFLIAIAPLVLAGLWLLTRRTHWGILVRAASQDREMVGALGVNQVWLFTSVFFVGSVLAGLAGALQIPREAVNLGMGNSAIAEAFAVVVIGGMGSIPGAFVAALIIGLLHAAGTVLFPSLTLVLTFLVMAVTLVIRPWGLFGRPDSLNKPHEFSMEPPLRRSGRLATVAGVSLALALAALPLVVGSYQITIAVQLVIMMIFAASLYFILGPGGMISFGHACYFGLGAYAAALVTRDLGWPFLAAMPAAVCAGAAGAVVFGWLSVRLSGVYFAMLTLAFAQMAWSVAFQWYDVTGGDNGIIGVWASGVFQDRTIFYEAVVVGGILAVLIMRHLLHAPLGYALRAARDSGLRAEALGIEIRRTRWIGFIIAGAVAGLAGGFFAFANGSVFPDYIHVTRSIDALVMVLLGGVQTIFGPLIGAATMQGLEGEVMRHTDLWRAVLGALILALVLLLPQGLSGIARRLVRGSETS